MGRSRLFAVVLACALTGSAWLQAQQPTTPAPSPDLSKKDGLSPVEKGNQPIPPEERRKRMERIEQMLQGLTPEQRENFRQNFERWKAMPPEERKELRDEAQKRKEQMRQAIDRAIADSGLNLTQDQREVYALRYTQERRKIEQQIRKQMEEMRSQLLKEAQARLKAEFSAAAAANPSPTASPESSPKP